MAIYGKSFYSSRDELTSYSANKILSIIAEHIAVTSVIDFGCGVGTWLKQAEVMGATNVVGVEGPWLQDNMFVSEGRLFKRNFDNPIDFNEIFDLAISLEVAEHVKEANADIFLDSICRCSDHVLFGAAIKGQGGNGHINEQSQSYWINKFESRGYKVCDCIRPKIWDNAKIPFWYKQNIFFFQKDNSIKNCVVMPADLVHPELFKIYSDPGVVTRFNHFIGIPKYLFRKFFT